MRDQSLTLLSDDERRRFLTRLDRLPPDGRLEIPADIPTTGDECDVQAIRFHHVHLPKLDEAGVVEWDRQSSTVGKGAHFEEIRPLLAELVKYGTDRPTAES